MDPMHTDGHSDGVPRTMDRRYRWLLGIQLVLGWAIIQVAGRLSLAVDPSRDEYFLTWPLESVYSDPFCALLAIGGLFCASAVAGALHPRGAWLLGLASVLLWPPSVLVEIAASPTSHNLLPFEIVLYGPLVLPGLLGAVIGSLSARRFSGRSGSG